MRCPYHSRIIGILLSVWLISAHAQDDVTCRQVEHVAKFCVGDLLFQDINCGTLCDGVNQVTYGIGNTYVSHVAMVVNVESTEPLVVEAVSSGVIETPVNTFLARSIDSHGKPRVILERLKAPYRKLIPAAVKYAQMQLYKPYNAGFAPNHGESFYCSQLIYAAFMAANRGRAIFHENRMNFLLPGSSGIESAWVQYFAQLKKPIPQGQLGTNPGMMSRESALLVVKQLGKLRQHLR